MSIYNFVALLFSINPTLAISLTTGVMDLELWCLNLYLKDINQIKFQDNAIKIEFQKDSARNLSGYH